MKEKIIFINQVTGPIVIDIVNVFARQGHIVVLYAGQVEMTYANVHPNVRVKNLCSYKRSSSLLRVLTWVVFFIQSFVCLFFEKRTSRLFIVSNPPIAPFLTLFFRFKYDILIFDIFPNALNFFTKIKSNSLIYKAWGKANKYIYSKANILFTISDTMKKILTEYLEEDKIKVIYNWTNTDFIKPIPKEINPFVKKYCLENKFVVMYSGNLGLTHDIESIVEAAELLLHNDKIIFVIIGDGAKKKSIEEYVSNRNLRNVLMLPFQNANDLPYSMTASDIAVVTLGTGGEGLSVPSKTYYFLAAGSIILAIAEKHSELSKIVIKYNNGKSIQPRDISGVIKFIVRCADSETEIDTLKSNSRKASMEFTQKNAFDFYRHLYY